MAEERFKRLCQNCGNNTIFEVHGTYSDKELLATDIYHITEWRMMECMTCSLPMLEQTTKVIQEKRRGGYEEDYEEWEEILEEPKTSIFYPTTNLASIPLPLPDMPEEVTNDYNEARAIFGNSPRSSAALLRLALQKLCKHLGEPGKSLDDDIGALVAKGLSIQIQQALDIIRVIGNNAVHPGVIDLHEEKETVFKLFEIINFIVNQMITQPQEIARIYNKLPEGPKKAIEQRSQKNSKRLQDNR
jgi:hypothetical protein